MAKRRSEYIFVQEKPKRNGWGCLFTLLALVLVICGLAFVYNAASNSRVSVESEKVSVMNLDRAYEGFTVLHMTDLHAADIGSDAELWQSVLQNQKWDAVVLGGDMVGSEGDFEPMLSLIHILQQLRPDAPIYFIAGDDDPAAVVSTPRGTPEALNDWVRVAQQAGAIFLDAPVSQAVGKKTVWFVPESLYGMDAAGSAASLQKQKETMEEKGQQYEVEGGAAYRALCYRLDVMQRTVEAQQTMLSSDLQIAVAHAPLEKSYIRTSIEWADDTQAMNFRAIDLLLTGHYCGGQWRLPGLGPVYVPELGWFPGDEGIQGMQRINSINQYISPGLGASEYYPLKGRLFNSPAVTLLKFTSTLY